MFVNMFAIKVCVLVLFATTDVQGRYVFEPTLHGSIEANKIISTFEDAVTQCKIEGAVLAAPVNEQLRDEMMALIGVNNHSTPYFINAKLVHSHNLQFVSSEGVSLDDMSVSDMIEELDPRDGECLAMDSRTIRVVSCSVPLPYMCYKENDTNIPLGLSIARVTSTESGIIKPTTKEQTVNCGPNSRGYLLNLAAGSCYKYHSEKMSWNDADSTCRSEGGYLAFMNDQQESKVVLNMIQQAIWVGKREYHNQAMDEFYNDPMFYFNYMECVILNHAQDNTMTCDTVRPFLCERNTLEFRKY
ncbi:uncharacterized protein LOC142983856 [Anticarsia gemmatalis]|uniref:uncharacterized protein LOC142983856 n=1 Tax=Anticarsia gemmatalis TaxID=129554 RepID=UPI003F768627